MPHYRHLGRATPHRKAILRNLVTSLVKHERIETTITRAKEMRKHVERMMRVAKKGDNTAYKRVGAYLYERKAA